MYRCIFARPNVFPHCADLVSHDGEVGERRREVIQGVIKNASEGEAEEGGGKVVDGVVEIVEKGESCDGGGEGKDRGSNHFAGREMDKLVRTHNSGKKQKTIKKTKQNKQRKSREKKLRKYFILFLFS